MAKQIEGVYEKVFECAKKEFLEKGYKDASLRIIAANAETTTSAIYTRFHDKEGLFTAIVQSVVDYITDKFFQIQESFHQVDKETQKEQVYNYSFDGLGKIIDYIYENFDTFQILVNSSYGTKFNNFIDTLVQGEVEYTYKFLQVIGYESSISPKLSKKLLHIVNTSFYEGVFEVVRHKMSKKEAIEYISYLREYHAAGFNKLFPF